MLAWDFFKDTNYAEAVLWFVMGLIVLLSGTRLKLSFRGRLLGAVVLVLFGVSDIVEASTGAWWRPWWLLVWKGICVAILLPGAIGCIWQKPSSRNRRSSRS